MAKRYALAKELLAEVRQKRDTGIDFQFAIDNPRGLSIRVRNGETAYYIQARTKVRGIASTVVKRRLANVGDLSFSEVKSISAEAIVAIKNGRNVDAVLGARLTGKDGKAVAIAVDQADAADRQLWTFEELITAYIHRTKKKAKNSDQSDEERVLRQSSITEIESRLRDRPENATLNRRFVKELRLEDLEEVRDRIDESGAGPSSGAKYVDLSKRVLRWGLNHRRRFTGLEPASPWWEALSHEYEMGDRSNRYLTPAQIGMLIALLEAVRALDGNTNLAVLGALQASWMIPQRSTALVNMRSLVSTRWVNDPAPERAGWRVYTWLARDVKNKRDIKLSVPPSGIEILERVARYSAETLESVSEWAFPQDRNKYHIRAHADGTGASAVPSHLDKPITPSALNQALNALAGRKPGWPDLLSIVGLPNRIGPHDLRRALTTFFENFGEGAYASALLDHRVSGVDKMSREVAAVTQGVYSAADRVAFKAEGLLMWLAAVVPAYETAKNDPRLAQAVEARKRSLADAAASRVSAKRAVGNTRTVADIQSKLGGLAS
jgi:hypothetical protein